MSKSEIKTNDADVKNEKASAKGKKKQNSDNKALKTKANKEKGKIMNEDDSEIVVFNSATNEATQDEKALELSIEQKLHALYNLQQIDSEIDKIRIIRGELPLEVQDLEDEIAGLETRIANFNTEIEALQAQLSEKNNAIVEHKAMIKKYEAQQMNVRNNREYDAITKEIEFQDLEIQLCEKRIREFSSTLEVKKEAVEQAVTVLKDRKADFEVKQSELIDIVTETEKEEIAMQKKSTELQAYIEPRLLNAYTRIRNNARNGLAVVMVERDACGGCFSKIPPQRQLDIRMHKKIIVCEYCGRILVDQDIANKEN
jgi:predicted  nucleic acid-binding Zn-ribbon protein